MVDEPIELLTIGRVSVDLYAEQLGVPIRDVRTFRKSVGGTATNVAVAAARLGRHAAVLTKVGADPFGEYVRWALADTFGVDTRFVGTHPTLHTPLAFAELDPPEDPRITFYRAPSAPDLSIEPGDVDAAIARRGADPVGLRRRAVGRAEPLDRARPARPRGPAAPRRSSTSTGARSSGTSRPAPPAELDRALANATMAVGNRAECEIAVGTTDPDEAADRLLGRGLTGAIVKLGGDGVLVATASERWTVRGRPGDGRVRARCRRRVRRRAVPRAAQRLVAARVRPGTATPPGRSSPARLMCADDMPTADEIDALLDTPAARQAST